MTQRRCLLVMEPPIWIYHSGSVFIYCSETTMVARSADLTDVDILGVSYQLLAIYIV
ncbi:hypothetical protein HOLleu_17478 [Holothuria leucospilota]|uniref:Uncharacterized protein n=1 Tax=Holothuria leucospilota TaxID=206669 RepID=A0A9Q1C288_HOLLE|nr:hypothetical protein HOLleu_17478 [Holothuria leucospilota]